MAKQTEKSKAEYNKKTRFIKGDPRAVECGKKSKRGASLKTVLKRIFDEQTDGISREKFVRNQIKLADKGVGSIAKLIWEYESGKVEQKVDVGGKGIQIVYAPKGAKGL